MNNTKVPKSCSVGRVAFFARLDIIKAEINQGLPLTMIFDRHQAVLAISYSSFCRLVARYAADAKLAGRTVSHREKKPILELPSE